MTLDDLIAICGPSCGKCPAYIATRSGNRSELQRIADEWTKALGRAYAPEDIICDGCRVPAGRRTAYCATCNIRVCARDKGALTCAHCSECPCEKIVSPGARQVLADLKESLRGEK